MPEMHLQNFKKLQSRKKRRNLSKSPLFGITACHNAVFIVPASKSDIKKLVPLDFRLWRIFARPAPGELALRSSGGECEPTLLLRKSLGEIGTIPAQKGHPRGVSFFGWDSWIRTNVVQESKSCALTDLAISQYMFWSKMRCLALRIIPHKSIIVKK